MSDKKKKKRKPADAKEPWYADGLRFECTQCGDCCSGEPGYVWVDDGEIQAMAENLKMSIDDFKSEYIREVGGSYSLTEYSDGDCILLDRETRKCKVYDGRPIQCRTWPFWDSTLDKKRDWKETCEVCPGAGKGRLYTLEEIEFTRNRKSV